MTEPAASAGRSLGADELGLEMLATLVERSVDGVAVLDEDLRVLYVNPAAAELLGFAPDALRERSALVTVPQHTREATREVFRQMSTGAGRGAGTIVRPDGQEREIEYSMVVFEASGRKRFSGFFRDITGSRRGHQREQAFARIAASVAFAESLETTLDGLAASVAEATAMTACAVVVCDDTSPRLRVAGTHGLPADYGERFQAALDAGVGLPAVAAFETGQTVIVEHASEDPALASVGGLDQDLQWATLVCLPMTARGQAVGALKCFFGPGNMPDPDRMIFMAAVAHQAAVAVDNARWFARAAEGRRRQEALVQAGLAFASELSLSALLEKVVESGCNLTDARSGALAMVDQDGHVRHELITHGLSTAERAAIGDPAFGRGVLAALFEGSRPVRLTSTREDPRSLGFAPNHPAMTTLLGVPIVLRGRNYGGLYVTEKRAGLPFSDDDERSLITLAAQAAIAIENTHLFAEAKERLALEARHRLARDLHDSVSQAVFSMTLETRAAQLAMEQQGIDPAGPVGLRLARLRELTQGALAEMRAMIFELRPEALSEEGLVAGLRKHAGSISARSGLAVDIDAREEISLPADVEEQLYRMAQEALNNVVKHAEANHVSVGLARADGTPARLILEVSDDGRGFDPSPERPGHLGLTTMRQRVERLRGRFEVSSAPGTGTTVRAVIPLAATSTGKSASGLAPEHGVSTDRAS